MKYFKSTFSLLFNNASSRGWLVGAGLTFPFFANPFQVKYLGLLIVLPLLIHVLRHGVVFCNYLTLNTFLVAIYAAALALVGAVSISDSNFKLETIGNVIVAIFLVVIYLSASDRNLRAKKIPQGFFSILCFTAACFGTLGLTKYWLQINGITFRFLIGCGGDYPQGSSFCGDYNNFATYMLLAGIGFSWFLTTSRNFVLMLFYSVCLAIVLSAAYYSGSRRFFLSAPVIPLMWITCAYLRNEWRAVARFAAMTSSFIVMIFIIFSTSSRLDSLPPNAAIIGLAEASTSLDTSNKTISDISTEPDLIPRTVGIPLLIGSVINDQKLGLTSRLDRWAFGMDLIKLNGYFLGSGLDYHNKFSCYYSECKTIDYPHSPIISFWISFGVAGLLLSIFFYASLFQIAKFSGKEGLLNGSTFALVILLPYSLFSGDTYLSLATVISAGLVMLSSLPTMAQKS
jgi:hypothetical protein